MNRVVFVLADLFSALPGEPGQALPLTDVPGIPELEWVLARSNQLAQTGGDSGMAGWRDWMATEIGGMGATGVAASGRRWLATPVHYVAGLDTVRLHPEGLITLGPAEQQLLAEDFARVFSDGGWQLQSAGGRELLLRGPPLAVNAPDPARFLGVATGAGQLRGADAATLRRLQSEIEMWLHQHPINRARGSSRHTVNGLWLWGQQYLKEAASDANGANAGGQQWRILGEDLAARSIVERAGGHSGSLPGGWDLLPADHGEIAGSQNLVIVLSLAGATLLPGMQSFSRDWLRPALHSWRDGKFARLEILCADCQWILSRSARWRFWRRRAHWLESLLGC
jgi:hypothetical protein